jgi:uncharacterized membrane protein
MRLMNHLLLPRGTLGRRFPTATLTAIEAAIAASERAHRAEIRFAIEVALDVACLWRVRTVRERALEVFADLGVWNTAERNGVLLYVLLAERRVEIVADRGFEGRVTEAEWRHCCTLVEREFRAGLWREGALRGIEAITALLIREFPGAGPNPNEQPNRPALL